MSDTHKFNPVNKDLESPRESMVPAPQNESAELNSLFEALAKAQMEMEVAKLDASNPFFKSKYADLPSVVKASRPFLAKNGLAVLQRILPDSDGKQYLSTRLCHASGQWMESRMAINPPKNDIQTVGSHITYLRRYNYASITGVVASDEDDDGENAMSAVRGQSQSAPKSEKISRAQLEVLSQELEGHEDLLESIITGYKIAKLADMLAKNYTGCINKIRQIKMNKEKDQ